MAIKNITLRGTFNNPEYLTFPRGCQLTSVAWQRAKPDLLSLFHPLALFFVGGRHAMAGGKVGEKYRTEFHNSGSSLC